MKVFRYMGFDECCRLCLHHRLLQQVDWHELGYNSTSKGFTFGLGDVDDAVHASRWLKGVVNMQYLLIADVADDVAGTMFKHCQGGYPDYRDYRTADPASQTRYVDEVYTTDYSLEDFKEYDFYVCLGISDKYHHVIVEYTNYNALSSMVLSNNIAYQQRFFNTNMKNNAAKSLRNDLTEYQSLCDSLQDVFAELNNKA